jgi:hypothetical protein
MVSPMAGKPTQTTVAKPATWKGEIMGAKVRFVDISNQGLSVSSEDVQTYAMRDDGVLRVTTNSGKVKLYGPSGWLSVERDADDSTADEEAVSAGRKSLDEIAG